MEHRKSGFVQLGQTVALLADNQGWTGFSSGLTEQEFDEFQQLVRTLHHKNGWFTEIAVRQSLRAWGQAMTEANLGAWLGRYGSPKSDGKRVLIICAGNIPLVGWHDVMSVLLAGHQAVIKLSSDDDVLIPALLRFLVKFDPSWEGRFEFVMGKVSAMDAVIATGSNNTSRYFEYYFSKVPHIIRKSRTSIAVLDGGETEEELKQLGHDIFDYFGLGCRNVSRLFIPQSYVLDTFFQGIFSFSDVVNHNKYANNYDYNKAVWLLDREQLLDNGFVLLKEEKKIAAPTGSLYYERYNDITEVEAFLKEHDQEIQCVVGHKYIPFGQAQSPELWDYADGVDTMAFLIGL